jgi:hypothetical protein
MFVRREEGLYLQRLDSRVFRSGPASPEEDEVAVYEGDGIDGGTPFPQAPACMRQMLTTSNGTLVEDASNGDAIGGHESL